MSSQEKSVQQKYITTIRNGKPFTDYTPEYKALLRHRTRWPDRVFSALVGFAGAAVIGTVVAAASYVLPLVPVAGHAGMAALSAVASSAGLLAAAGVAALGGVFGLAAVGLAGAAAVYSALRIYEQYEMVKDAIRPVSVLSAGGVTLAAALGMAMTAAPEEQPAAVSKMASASTAFDTARRGKLNNTSLTVQTGHAPKKTAPALGV